MKKEEITRWPFKKESGQKSFGVIASMLGLLLTAIGLIKSTSLIGIGLVVFLVGLFYLIEVIFN